MALKAGRQEFGPGPGYGGGGEDSRSLLDVQVSRLPTDRSYGVRKGENRECISGFRSRN